jgi:hypothetical protein
MVFLASVENRAKNNEFEMIFPGSKPRFRRLSPTSECHEDPLRCWGRIPFLVKLQRVVW